MGPQKGPIAHSTSKWCCYTVVFVLFLSSYSQGQQQAAPGSAPGPPAGGNRVAINRLPSVNNQQQQQQQSRNFGNNKPGQYSNVDFRFPGMPSSYEQYRNQLMYPYDWNDWSPIDASKQEHEVAFNARLRFFGFGYRYAKIHQNGYIHFSGSPAQFRWPIQFPYQPVNTIREKDPAMIAPWLAYQNLHADIPESGVYVRVLNLRDTDDSNSWLHRRIRDDFQGGMIGSHLFVPTFAMIVTWRNTTVPQKLQGETQTNTFQVVIASDEQLSYAMFNYEQIDWTASSDLVTGKNGLNPFIGFNAGNTTRFYEFLPYSQEPRVSQIHRGGKPDMPGRYFFQINEEIYPGTCINWELDPHLIKQRPRLTFFPKYASMLGGTMINVTGPCFDPDHKIECQFQDMSGGRFPAVYRDRNHASCLMPPVFFHGYVDLTVSIGSRDAMFYGRFYIQPPELAAEDVEIIDNADKEEAPSQMMIQWAAEKLSLNNDSAIEIHVWGFNDDQEYPGLTHIRKLDPTQGSTVRPNRGVLSMETFRDYDDGWKTKFQWGFISVNLTNSVSEKYQFSPVVWSRPMPLSWYFHPQWTRQFGKYWKDQFCQDWYDREVNSDRFAITLWRCPCTLKQSDFDRGRYAPDILCNSYSKRCDPLYKGAQQCVRTGRPSVGGSGQTCCYDMEGELIMTADTMYGGRPSRFFSYGILPYNQRAKVPTLSYWTADAIPFFHCCHWQKEKDDSQSCSYFKYWRTSQDCTAYQPPGYAAVFGDPHFQTFDGQNYTFNGKGEFSLVRVNDPKGKLEIQGRFEQRSRIIPADHIMNGTMLMAVAARDNVSSTVEFHLRPEAARWQYQLYLIVDNEFIYFWDETMRVQNFKGVTIYQPTGYYNMSKIVAMFDSGAGVEVLVVGGQLVLNTFLPIEFINITRGLLGFWDKDKDNDLMYPESNQFVVPSSGNARTVFEDFGNKWRLNESASLFNHHMIGYSFGHYDDKAFVSYPDEPLTIPDNFEWRAKDIEDVCSSSKACIYDFIVTSDKKYAEATKENEAAAQIIAKELKEEVIRCPALEKPAHGRKSEIRNFVGKTVRFTCNDGYRLVGHEYRQCKEYGLWSWGTDPVCISSKTYSGRTAGLVIGILLPVLLIVFCIVFLMWKRSKRYEKDYHTGSRGLSDRQLSEKKPMVSEGQETQT